ncbi:MAG: PAS domain S-box protein [Anaerolineae bacterium]
MAVESISSERFSSEEVYARVLRASPLAFSLATLDEGRYLEVNDRFLRITGYTRAEVIGRRSTELGLWTTWADRARVVQALRNRQPVDDLELAIRTKSGELRYVRAFFESLDVSGQRCIFSLFHDVTERKQAEEALHTSEQHLQLVLNVTADAVYDWDVRVGMTRWNHGLQSLFGYAGETLRAHAWWEEHIHPDDLERAVTSLNQAVAQRSQSWSCEYRYRRADGSYAHVIDRGYFIYGEDGRTTRMVGVMVDITDRVHLAQAQAHAALEERRRLARDLHDSVTQSLYSLTLVAEATRRLAKTGDLERVEHQVARLGETAQQALKEMRLLVYELRPQALDQDGLIGALQQRLDAVEKRSGVNARLIVEQTDRLPEPIESALYFIAQEALNNALKHSGATSVTIKLCGTLGRVELHVSDNGRGFEQAAITDRGGLGLTSMRERAEQLGGTLMLDSTPERGTHLTVDISWQEAVP